MLSLSPGIVQALIQAGGGLLIALVILVGLYSLADKHGARFIEAQQQQAAAMGRQAESMEDLRTSIKDFVSRDGFEHREMLVLLRFIAQNGETEKGDR
jgi:hypothetical protein